MTLLATVVFIQKNDKTNDKKTIDECKTNDN